MIESFKIGDNVRVDYMSSRSNNIVSRTGRIIQEPSDNKSVIFVSTGDNQLTGIHSGKVFSVTIDTDKHKVLNNTFVGKLESIAKF